ncbi:hypothetical protein M514_14722 [Trichuris suis]|uniref:Uncharacterized protein n=1 Tax=Trichuris suis TaxID=68888 RepID=A0A085M642_9BILA|nr:hypothetical protein M513_13418 [Trichuris suis]KFD52688.1 hypothetical protein M513_06535 [Trichuris suis]KFD53964.1 hypothetical protein M513_05231 [Trichuris suis]KFD72818.1 hypothetical protein M514_14722 [Trichuris suis]
MHNCGSRSDDYVKTTALAMDGQSCRNHVAKELFSLALFGRSKDLFFLRMCEITPFDLENDKG